MVKFRIHFFTGPIISKCHFYIHDLKIFLLRNTIHNDTTTERKRSNFLTKVIDLLIVNGDPLKRKSIGYNLHLEIFSTRTSIILKKVFLVLLCYQIFGKCRGHRRYRKKLLITGGSSVTGSPTGSHRPTRASPSPTKFLLVLI